MAATDATSHLPSGVDPAGVDLLAEGSLPRAWAARWAERPSAPVVYSPETGWVSGAELDERSRRAAGALAAAGLRAGDRVLTSGASTVDLIAAHVGALGSGLVVVPANTGYTAGELGHIADDAGVAAAILDEPARLAPRSGVALLSTGEAAAGRPADPGPGPGGDSPALIGYTSGTTGRPKGAMLTHANLLASAAALRLAWRWEPDDRLVLALPLFHMHGLGVGVHGTLLSGASMVLVPRFDAGAVIDAMRDHRCSLFFGVPTMYHRLAGSPRAGELSSARLLVSGSAPLPPALFEALERASGQRVLERYGMTETVMLASNPYEGERRAGSVGLPLPGVELRLRKENGEILVRGPNVFSGYRGRPEETAAAFEDGWFRTGDVGSLDPDGYLRIVGRTKELIISGGYNVYPREVEDVLLRHPGVAEAAVAGTPDPAWGEIVTAYIVVAAATRTADLEAHCAALLAPYKRPRAYHLVTALPRNALGKVQRDALRPGL